ncbi:outer membrane protein assembly factor BamC [Methylobacter sp. S3L5C]|uniref:outer membrane protein assembly factor BamC n=1 Tax=Methylobacter sp. S3L5C TaxID=2839024 RepID=UPI001FAD75EA|nr:outer membrane protein assembly factor BamC [Methylobacter sp. S3L5C]UOA07718.1 outer membrane protein assembly factor BamC [Methylobacter sp. S3L5C]
MKVKTGSLFIMAILLLSLSACSYIKSLFPDKEKDYQYTTEIPPLILPNDLKTNYVPNVTTSTAPAASSDTNANMPEDASGLPTEEATSTATPTTEVVIPDAAITVERIQVTDGGNRLRINTPFITSWRIVNKSLSRKAIEVTERNQEARLITIQYDAEGQKVKDESYLDEVKFFFAGIDNNDKTYLLKLEANNEQTDVVVLDKDQQPLSDADSAKLLMLLEETIKADLAKK